MLYLIKQGLSNITYTFILWLSEDIIMIIHRVISDTIIFMHSFHAKEECYNKARLLH